MSENSKKSRTGLWILIALLAIYLVISTVFSFIALPNTYLNGENISYQSKDSILGRADNDYQIDISGRDNKNISIASNDIGFTSKLPKNARIDQNSFLWPLYFFGKKDEVSLKYDVKYDEDKLDQILKESSIVSKAKDPQDAKLIYKNGGFDIKKEDYGDKVDYPKFKEKIEEAIENRTKEVKLEDKDYISPKLTSDSEKLKEILNDGKDLLNTEISFAFNGYDIKLAKDDLISLYDQTDDGFILNMDYLAEYVSNIADMTDTYGIDRKFNATGIGEITVNPGVYGFILDQEQMQNKIATALDERKSTEIEPSYERYGYDRYEDGSDLGDTYVEVDLSRQHLWFYKQGSLILESDFVSGIPNDGWSTNKGVGSILDKQTNAKLKGIDFDGSDYETPVNYWIPIGWDAEGFHDASWRSSFGGSIYLSSGSHGCLNLPPSVAGELFENVEVGTPVVVYESSTDYAPPMAY